MDVVKILELEKQEEKIKCAYLNGVVKMNEFDNELKSIRYKIDNINNKIKEIKQRENFNFTTNDLDDYIFNYKELEKEYNHSQKVIDNLEEECERLDQNNNNLIDFIKHILEMLKDFFRRILLSKNEADKNKTVNILKDCYEKDLYNSYDLIDISKDTDKEIEVNDFIKEETLEKEYDYFD